MKIAVLCAQPKSIYSQFTQLTGENNQPIEVEIYDKKRDARNFPGGLAVVAHPPCRCWGRLKHMVKIDSAAKLAEKDLGRFCAQAVINNGGVLEHPFDSGLFADMGLPSGGLANDKGFTLEIPQRQFGHSMVKLTWLFFSRIRYEDIEPFKPALHGQPLKQIEHLSHKQREATPPRLAAWLLRQAAKATSPAIEPVRQPVQPGKKIDG
jgi:hypothetical protein